MENEKFEEQNITEENALGDELFAEYVTEEAAPREEKPAEPVRKASPFADAPYEMNFDHEPQVRPAKPKKVKRAHPGRGKRILAAVAALALMAGSCGITAAVVNDRWEKKTQALEQTINQKFLDLQAQVDAANQASAGVTVAVSVSVSPSVTDAVI